MELTLQQVADMRLEELSNEDWLIALGSCAESAERGDVERARVKWLTRRFDGKTQTTDSE